MLFPVTDGIKNGNCTDEIITGFKKMAESLEESTKKGEYPIAYAVYMRYLQGTNGGLSITQHQPGHHICAMDMTTGLNFPGFASFRDNTAKFFLQEMGAKLHWGKNMPEKVDFSKVYGESFIEFKNTLERWYQTHGMEVAKSPLLSKDFCIMLELPYAPVSAPCHENMKIKPAIDSRKMAKELMSKVDDKTEEGKVLCKHLQEISDTPAQTNTRHSLFKTKDIAATINTSQTQTLSP